MVKIAQPSSFVCPGDASVAINSELAKPLAACTHLSSRASQLFEPQVQKIAFSHTAAHIFVSPGDAPAITKQYLHGWKDNSMLAKPLAPCTHLYSTVSELCDA